MGESWGRVVSLAVLGLVATLIGGWLGRSPGLPIGPVATPPGGMAASVPPTTDGATGDILTVHVSGRVSEPGVIHVPAGAIVADAIAAAGGLLGDASVESLNLAAEVASGEHIVVPGPGGPPTGAKAVGGDGGPPGLVSLSQATAADLETLPGVGPVLAERIVAWRDQNGGFEAVEDLLEVPGIGEAKLTALRDLVAP